nr:VIT1/CCC1 transporter family protein [Tessaracoccus coleopterorum]
MSSAADSQRSVIARVGGLLRGDRRAADEQLVETFRSQGLSQTTAEAVVAELSDSNRSRVLLSQRYHLAEDEVLNPWHAAIASAVAFLAGAILPFLTILLVPYRGASRSRCSRSSWPSPSPGARRKARRLPGRARHPARGLRRPAGARRHLRHRSAARCRGRLAAATRCRTHCPPGRSSLSSSP